ncbi:MAG: hypothetical protein KKC76_17595 [Proteobacteria bacterium]|nr:hypothetical protein [Pseudomonadota bacterium]MBU4295699.1 hypothetical protein [Pseudomonadota bacterium]MCG2749294.1 hypothetical protein [Desulfobulbaceae bacterium]
MTAAVPTTLFFDLGDTLLYYQNNQDRLYADCLDTLQILQQRGYRLGLLSNQPPGTTVNQVRARLNSLGLLQFIEPELVTISTEIAGNAGKPAQPIFDLALQKAGQSQSSQQSIFVTETASHIAAARSYGWRAILKCNNGTCQPADGECAVGLAGLLDMLPALGDVANTNLHLAPRPKVVDGLWAVPMDISRITASLTFDADTSTGTGSALLEFKLGRHSGNPIFDLRQTITGLWLDGAEIPIDQAAPHDFGGGTGAELRVLERVLAAGSSHELQITYSLGLPQAAMSGSYPPQIAWSAGPRLTFNFGFTDLAPGRYLEAWVPANLIFDQFELILTLQIVNTSVAHSLITNGSVTSLGANHWQAGFPAVISAFSPLVEVRPADSVTSLSDTVVLPGSGTTITIEAWKTLANTANLATQINNLKTYLADNETAVGPYLHGNRFVAFIHLGGMEYDGATTTSQGPLRHETYHSWWGRGLKPASQPDAWQDEAWTSYQIDTEPVSVPFDFAAAPVELCPRNPWVRKTAGLSYSSGTTFWQGMAGFFGTAALDGLMKDFYAQCDGKPVRTTDIEEFLLHRMGDPLIVDAFHRFVYGFVDPSPAPEVWLRDDFSHTGTEQWSSGSFWNSPDLWVRNSDDDMLTHQSPVTGFDNWIYARVRNLSTTTRVDHFSVAFNVKPYAGVEFVYPQDFLPATAAASGFDLAPGASVIVKARWAKALVPPAGTHSCLLASVFSRSNHPLSNKHVWEQNALAQKNLTIIDVQPDTWVVLPFVVANRWSSASLKYTLELVRMKKYADLKAELIYLRSLDTSRHALKKIIRPVPEPDIREVEDLLARRHTEAAKNITERIRHEIITSGNPGNLDVLFPAYKVQPFPARSDARISLILAPQHHRFLGLRVYVPKEAKKGDVIHVNLVKRSVKTKKVMGGIALEIHVA